ncbi:MAG TPA: VWA domain-containing protein [Cytophagaceae bacterium]|nr:VWA domain-containing protein [Cytophagaceae bacterium]
MKTNFLKLHTFGLALGLTLFISSCDKNITNGTLKEADEARYDKSYQYAPSSTQERAAGAGHYNMPAPEEEYAEPLNTESYEYLPENEFLKATENPLSTFSIDVDNASYTNCRRFIDQGSLPPVDAVRIEEFVNYFNYDYTKPTGKHPFSINTELSECPWNKTHKLVHIGIQGKRFPFESMAPINLVFLVDVSGSMSDENKLPLLKKSLSLLVGKMRSQDRISLVVYAGAAGVVLPSTAGNEKEKIIQALDNLQSGGSTAGGEGIILAYKIAKENFIENGNNRVLIATDGDFNVGASSDGEMTRLVESKRDDGIFLTVLGFGMGNYKDSKMESIADHGNGNYFYIDNIGEAKKTLVDELDGTLYAIAKDVKIQIEFNPTKVQAYRLVGYENRMLKKEDFNDDKKDAGELGAGHTVTALYEIVPVGVKEELTGSVDPLRYQKTEPKKIESQYVDEMMVIKFRYKEPKDSTSKLIVHTMKDREVTLGSSSENFRFSAAVAEFGMLLRDSKFKGDASFASALELAKNSKGTDEEGYRSEFTKMISTAALLKGQN